MTPNTDITSTPDFVLYSYFRSSAAYRVRIALNLKQIAFEYRAVHLINNGGEQHLPEYAKLNPSHDVPTLLHKGRPVGQTIAILDYLDRVAGARSLFPSDPYQRALVLQTCEIVNSGSHPLINVRVQKALGTMLGASEEQKKQWAIHWLDYGLKTLEQMLRPHAGKYSFGDEVSAADCYVIPHLFGCDRFGASIEAYPTLKRIKENCAKLEAFIKAAPDKQPDYQP